MDDKVYNFMVWMYKSTSRLQDNVVIYRDTYYFTDRRTVKGNDLDDPDSFDGGLDDLWAAYLKEILG